MTEDEFTSALNILYTMGVCEDFEELEFNMDKKDVLEFLQAPVNFYRRLADRETRTRIYKVIEARMKSGHLLAAE